LDYGYAVTSHSSSGRNEFRDGALVAVSAECERQRTATLTSSLQVDVHENSVGGLSLASSARMSAARST
jgi:hypothetical protein